jgi:hypothetical protein
MHYAATANLILRFSTEVERDAYVSADPATRSLADPPSDISGFTGTWVNGVPCEVKSTLDK